MRRSVGGLMSVLLFGACLLQPASSAVILTTSTTAPGDDVIVSHSFDYNNFNWIWQWTGTDTDHRDIGQSFPIYEANDVIVDKVTVKLGSVGYGSAVAGADYRLETWTVTDQSDSSGNTQVDSQTGTMPGSEVLGAGGFWTFDIDDVLLANDQHYAFLLAFEDGPTANLTVGLAHRYGPPDYGGGRMILRESGSWVVGSYDLNFYVQGTVTPEPGTLTFAALAGVLGVLVRRRRKASP